MNSSMSIRPEQPADHQAIYQVNRQAFESPAEAELVEALRAGDENLISLVAFVGDQLLGHIMFTPVTVTAPGDSPDVMALGPMAVLPEFQGQGIGSSLVNAGLNACRAAGQGAVVVLGHRDFYPRFGFRPAAHWDLHFKSPKFDPYFMALELVPGALEGAAGYVRYLPQFDAV